MNQCRGREPLAASALNQLVADPRNMWRRVDVVAETGSTNADLIADAASGSDIDGVVLLAEHQTAGRGRNGRSWTASPYAQLTFSAGIGASLVDTRAWGWLPLAAGLAIVDTASAAGVSVGLKWPNDVLAHASGVRPQKLAGVLAEVAAMKSTIVLGIGFNVEPSADDAADPHAVSLAELGATLRDRTAIAVQLLNDLATRVDQWRNRVTELAADYREHSLTIGTPVRALLPGGREVVGTAIDVDDHGRLRIVTGQDGAGETMVVSAGDIVHLRTFNSDTPG